MYVGFMSTGQKHQQVAEASGIMKGNEESTRDLIPALWYDVLQNTKISETIGIPINPSGSEARILRDS